MKSQHSYYKRSSQKGITVPDSYNRQDATLKYLAHRLLRARIRKSHKHKKDLGDISCRLTVRRQTHDLDVFIWWDFPHLTSYFCQSGVLINENADK